MNGTKVLLIMPFYFNYQEVIKENLIKRGYDVFMIDEDINEFSFLHRLVSVYAKNIYQTVVRNYYANEFSKLPSDIDVIFIIKGSTLSMKEFEVLKSKYPLAKKIMYQWDSVKNYEHAIEIANFCDFNYTFDPDDARLYGWKYRALFFNPSCYKKVKERNIDLAFICSLHSQRLRVFKQLLTFAKKNHLVLFDYLFSNKWSFYRQKYLCRNAAFDVNSKLLKFTPLPMAATIDVYNHSKALVDFKFSNQVGLTMRTIESLGHKCKLVTNNKRVVEEDFYNPHNIFVYDEDDFEIPISFLVSEYEPLPSDIYYKYSIEGWLDDLLEND